MGAALPAADLGQGHGAFGIAAGDDSTCAVLTGIDLGPYGE